MSGLLPNESNYPLNAAQLQMLRQWKVDAAASLTALVERLLIDHVHRDPSLAQTDTDDTSDEAGYNATAAYAQTIKMPLMQVLADPPPTTYGDLHMRIMDSQRTLGRALLHPESEVPQHVSIRIVSFYREVCDAFWDKIEVLGARTETNKGQLPSDRRLSRAEDMQWQAFAKNRVALTNEVLTAPLIDTSCRDGALSPTPCAATAVARSPEFHAQVRPLVIAAFDRLFDEPVTNASDLLTRLADSHAQLLGALTDRCNTPAAMTYALKVAATFNAKCQAIADRVFSESPPVQAAGRVH